MSQLILLNKPFGVLCQFTDPNGRPTLADFIHQPSFYAAGRLDFDSEGLLLLTDNGQLQHQISHPRNKLPKTYWAQVEGEVTEDALQQLRSGVVLKDGSTAPAKARALSEPDIWARIPPVRERKNIPTSWLELTISEGRNRQVRRMTAAVGFPTLRLIRIAIGKWKLGQLQPGEQKTEQVPTPPDKSSPRAKANSKSARPSERPAKRRPSQSKPKSNPGSRPRRR